MTGTVTEVLSALEHAVEASVGVALRLDRDLAHPGVAFLLSLAANLFASLVESNLGGVVVLLLFVFGVAGARGGG